tara:strand:- start:133 stop:303 length:171 start_codon:yes stop_codon:yes gene_type:complete
MNKYEIITSNKIIIPQILKFLKNNFLLEFEFINSGKTNIKTAINAIVGINFSAPIF